MDSPALTGSAVRVGIPGFLVYIQGAFWGQHSNKRGNFAVVKEADERRREQEKGAKSRRGVSSPQLLLSGPKLTRQASFHETGRRLPEPDTSA